MFEKEQSHSKVLALINATVSHELRNPLNAINAINLQKKSLYDKVDGILECHFRNKTISNECMLEVKHFLIQLREG